jgi:predicted RNase H-like nuclease (RuvC/YqgF family)
MSTNPDQDDFVDDEPTDELPILLETVVLDPAVYAVGTADDDTGEHPALREEPETFAAADGSERQHAPGELADARAQIERLTQQATQLESRAAEQTATIDRLEAALDQATETVTEQQRAERQFTAELRDRETQFNGLLAELDRLREQLNAQDTELEQLRQANETAENGLAAARTALAATAQSREAPARHEPLTLKLREEIASLTDYIANRRTWWDGLQAEVASQRRRIAELEQELKQRVRREQRAEQVAEREQQRADELREALSAATSARTSRDRAPAPDISRHPAPPEPSADAPVALRVEPAAAAEAETPAPAHPPAVGDAEPADIATLDSEAAFEVVAQLEAELEHKREEIERREADVAERAQRLQRAEAEIAALRGELGAAQKTIAETRAELEDERRDKAQLETLIDQRNERLQSLEHDLGQKLQALEQLKNASPSPPRRAEPRQLVTDGRAPVLVCLTSDAPRNYELTKHGVTIGRSSQCDVQIQTQFVSRQHARLTVTRTGGVVIEDLGSTNGVFVNSVRVERQELTHGDLVTVGETQFRFLDTATH